MGYSLEMGGDGKLGPMSEERYIENPNLAIYNRII
jgi:hypothetical protein